MKRILASLTLLAFALPAPAFAVDGVEQVIMKCRVNALNVREQVACLEEALRARSPVQTTPNWSGITEDGRMPEQTGDMPVARSSGIPGGTVTGLGAEQVTLGPSNQTSAPVLMERSTVVDFAYNSKQRLILILSNGQVWKQRDGDLRTVDLDDGDRPTVIVREGMISGYRMSFPDLDREITVSRLR